MQKIGRYEIKSELGRGGVSIVYRAYDPRFKREVALEMMAGDLRDDPKLRATLPTRRSGRPLGGWAGHA